jgi:hypothetical protein
LYAKQQHSFNHGDCGSTFNDSSRWAARSTNPCSDQAREPDGGGLATAGSAAVLDFTSSTATLDGYQEVIESAGWRLDSYRRNLVFQNLTAHLRSFSPMGG